jgi:hypothetical protein
MSSRQAERHGAAHASRSGPASQRRRIVASKLAAPPRRPGEVYARLCGWTLARAHAALQAAVDAGRVQAQPGV